MNEEEKLRLKRQKRAEYMREWNRRNPDKVKANNERRKDYLVKWRRQNYLDHAEEIKEFHKNYYAEHKKEILAKTPARVKTWAEANPERMKEISRVRTRRRRAKVLGVLGEPFTVDQWLQLCDDYGNRCVYCNSKSRLEMDHLIPISSGGLHELSNIVPACRSCNAKKTDKSLLMFLHYCL